MLALVASSTHAEDLKKLNLDDASAIGTTIQTDTQVKAEGKSSIKITTQWPTTICLGEVTGPDVESAKLVYKAKVKSDLEGTAFLEMWAHVGGGQYFSKRDERCCEPEDRLEDHSDSIPFPERAKAGQGDPERCHQRQRHRLDR